MSDYCKKCDVACQEMLEASTHNAVQLGSSNPCHCLCVAIAQAVRITKQNLGMQAAHILALIIADSIQFSLNKALQDESESVDDNDNEVWN